MWLAGHTYAFRALPLEDALDRLVGLGFDDVELWLGHAHDDPDRAVDAVRRVGVRVRAVSAGGFYDSGSDVPVRAFELAAALDAAVVVMCVAPQLVSRLDALTPPTLRVAVENHWDQALARSRDVAAAIRSADLDACLDTGHALSAGERPDAFALALGDRLRHVHLKEGRRPSVPQRLVGRRMRRRFLPRPAPVRPDSGDLDVSALRSALGRIGFDGCVTVEHEGEAAEEALAALVARWREAS